MIKRLFVTVALLCAMAGSLCGQNTTTFGNITALGVPCGAANCVYYQLPQGTPWVLVTVSGTWTGVLETATTSAPNANYSNLDTVAWTALATETANGTWSPATSGATYLRVRATAWTSGTAQVNMAASEVLTPMMNPIFPGSAGAGGTQIGSAGVTFPDGSVQASAAAPAIAGLSGDGTGNVTVQKQLSASTVAATGPVSGSNIAPSVTSSPYNAVCDGITDDTAAIAAAESSAIMAFSIPTGKTCKTSLSGVSKHYSGAGVISLGTNPAQSGEPSAVMGNYDSNIEGINSTTASTGPTSIVWIGDSITFGFNSSGNSQLNQSYPWLVQNWLNIKEGGVGQGNYLSGGNFDSSRYTFTGTWALGTAGPLHADVVLQPGATISFATSNVSYLEFWYQQKATGGTITVTNGTGTYGSQSTAGAAANDVVSALLAAPIGTGTSQTITLTCTVNPCEITGIFASAPITPTTTPVFFEMQAFSGYSTADFTSAAVQASIIKQVPYHGSGGFWVYVLALGTNDIANAGKAVPSATFKANLLNIITAFKAAQGIPILTVPLRFTQGTYSPIYEPFDNYRQVVYQIARQYGYQVVDLSELNLASVGAYQSDGVHPNQYGYQIMADLWYRKLNLASLATATLPLGTATSPLPNVQISGGITTYGSNSLGLATSSGISFLVAEGVNSSTKGLFNFAQMTAGNTASITTLSSDVLGNWTAYGGLSATNGAISTTGSIGSYGTAQAIMADVGGTQYLVSTGANSSTKGAFNFLATTAGNTANATFLSSDTAGNWTALGTMKATGFIAGSSAGLSCSGTPTASFASVFGIVTHC